MIRAVLSMLLLAGLVLAGAARASAALVLHAAAELPGTRYTLGDIADIEAADPALRRQLSAIPIGAVPRHGYTDAVTRGQLEGLIRQQVSLAAIEWRGAAVVRIRSRGQRVAAELLSDAAIRALHGSLAGQYDTIELRPVSALQGVHVPAGTLRLEARVPVQQGLAQRMSALVDVSVDGEICTTVPVWFAVRATRTALLARVPLRPGEALRAEDFQTQTVDVARQSSALLPGDAALDGMRLRRGLEPGAVLGAAQVEARPPVARDERVAVRVVRGTVTIETTAQALSDARLGEMTRVRNMSTNESYSARVVGDGVVLVSAR